MFYRHLNQPLVKKIEAARRCENVGNLIFIKNTSIPVYSVHVLVVTFDQNGQNAISHSNFHWNI